MAAFTGDELDVELGQVKLVEVTCVGGEVAVTAGAGPVRIRGRVVRGEPLEISVERGEARVGHEPSRALLARLLNGQSPEAIIEVVAPADTDIRVRTVTAGVVVAGFRTSPTIATVSGAVTAADVGGLVATAVSGPVEAQHVSGDLSVNAVSGDVTVHGGRLDRVAVKAASGDVVLDVSQVGETVLNTVSGIVAVRLPEDAAVSLEASTVNGRLDCAFPLAGSVSTKRRLAGAIGGGGPVLRARTVSGDVTLLRGRLAPA